MTNIEQPDLWFIVKTADHSYLSHGTDDGLIRFSNLKTALRFVASMKIIKERSDHYVLVADEEFDNGFGTEIIEGWTADELVKFWRGLTIHALACVVSSHGYDMQEVAK